MDQVLIYSLYQRVWHWVQATSTLLLILTGLAIHFPDAFSLFRFPTLVAIHNVFAAVLLVNALFGMFYYFTTGEIKQLIPRVKGFLTAMLAQVKYYSYGIFRGGAYPHAKHPEQRLNPLQRIVYLMILNVLLPLQIVSGVVLWGAQRWPDLVAWLGGLPTLAFIHSLGAWLFATFLVAHVYLITTGRTPLSNLTTMVSGWEKLETTANSAGARNE